ncbi:MAG: hypothetical protein MJ175_04060 [Clostridia bacterium]|nr:hypothetical protein [Clostridia bacterium]
MKSRSFAAALAAALLLAAVTSCGSEDTPATPTDTTAPAGGETAAVTEEAEKTYSAALESIDYNGAEFRAYTSNYINGFTNNSIINYAEEETGEVVNDALFARDRFMEDHYNIKMAWEVDETGNTGTQSKLMTNSILSGDNSYHMILLDHAEICKALSMQGMLYPLNYVDGIDLKADYWMPALNDKCRIGNSLYYASCAISPRYYSSVYITMINRDMAKELDLPDVYDLVENGKWTLDAMFDMAKLAVQDMDGDGKLDPNKDRIGAMYGCQEGYVLAAGFNFIENQNGKLVCMFDDAKLITYMQKLASRFQENGIYYEGRSELDWDGIINNGNALFTNPCTMDLTDYRDLGYDYGILPCPKMDEAQKGYVGFSQPWVNVTPMIPITVTGADLTMAGVLTNALAAYGYDYIRPAVFDNVICLKGTRDEQSARIVNQIFENVTFDLSIDCGISSVSSIVSKYLARELGKQDITSMYAADKSKIAEQIQGLMDTYAKNEAEVLGQ